MGSSRGELASIANASAPQVSTTAQLATSTGQLRAGSQSPNQHVTQSRSGMGGRELYCKEQWEVQKPVIRRLYNVENKSYKQVVDILRTGHNFFPTRRQFYRKISEWGFEKNIKNKEMREIVQNLNQCESKDADPTIELRGHQVDPAKIERWQRRNGRVKDVVTPFISRPFEDAAEEREVSESTRVGSTPVSVNPNSIPPMAATDYSNGVGDSGKYDPGRWVTIGVQGSLKLTQLFEALRMECSSSIPRASLAFSSERAQLLIPELELAGNPEAEEWIETSVGAGSNALVWYSRDISHSGNVFSSVSERDTSRLSFSEWSHVDWDFSEGYLPKINMGPTFGISPFSASPELDRCRTSCFRNPSPLLQDLQIEENKCNSKLSHLERSLGAQNPETLAAMTHLGDIYANQYKYRQAERMYREVARSYQKMFGMKHVATLSAYLDVVDILKCRGEWLQALKVHQPAHEIVSKVVDPRRTVALRSNSIRTDILYSLGQIEEADKLCRQTLQIELSTLGPKCEATLYDMKSFAVVLRLSGRLVECEEMLRIILQLQREVADISEELARSNVHALIDVLLDQGRYEESKNLAMAFVERSETSSTIEHPSHLYSLFKAAVCSRMQGKWPESESQLRKILERQLQVFGEKDSITYQIWRELSCILRSTGRHLEATPLLEKSYNGVAETYGVSHPMTLLYCRELGDSYEKLGRFADALALYQQNVNYANNLGGGHSAALLKTMLSLARLLRMNDRYGEAVTYYEQCLSGFTEVYGLSDPLTLYACDGLGLCYERLGRYDHALALYQRTFDKIRRTENSEHPALTEVSRWIVGLRDFLARSVDVTKERKGLGSMEHSTPKERSMVEQGVHEHGWSAIMDSASPEKSWMDDVFDFELLEEGSGTLPDRTSSLF